MTNAPKWFSLVNAVVDTIGTGDFNPVQDRKTHAVMVKVASGLMSKGGIDGSLLEAFVSNVRIRAGERNFQAVGPVTLTRHQKTHARNQGWNVLPSLDELRQRHGNRQESGMEAECAEVDVDLFRTFQQAIRILSATNPQAFRDLSAEMTLDAAEKLRSWVLNEMKVNERNHETWDEAPLAQADMIAASPEHEGASRQEVVAAQVHEVADAPPARAEEEVGQGSKPAPTKPTLTIWVKEDKKGATRASGYLEAEGKKFALSFTGFDFGYDRIKTPDAAFANYATRTLLPIARKMEATTSGVASRSTFSPLFARDDTFARNAPASNADAVFLEWVDGQPGLAWVVAGDVVTGISIKREAGDRFKGVAA